MILRRLAVLSLVVFATLGAVESAKVRNLAGELVDPLATSPARTATVLLFIIFQKQFVAALLQGAVKG